MLAMPVTRDETNRRIRASFQPMKVPERDESREGRSYSVAPRPAAYFRSQPDDG
jgi:hypothetical protein